MPDKTVQDFQKWVIVVLIYADFTDTIEISNYNDIRLGLESLFSDLLNTKCNPEICRQFVIMDSIYKVSEEESVYNMVAKYEISNSVEKSKNIIQDCSVFYKNELPEFENANTVGTNRHALQQDKILTAILKTIEIKPEEEILFITWDHGAGFGIFRDERSPEDNRTQVPPGLLNISQDTHPFLNSFFDTAANLPEITTLAVSTSSIYNNLPEILTNEELSKSLNRWLNSNFSLPERKVGVLLMMNCWMMNMHTMFAVRNVVQCMVAAQGDMSNPGYYYESIIKLINESSTFINPQILAAHCYSSSLTDELKIRAKNMKLDIAGSVDSWIIIPINLQKLDKVFDTFQNLITCLLEVVTNNDSIKNLIKYVRAVSYDFTSDFVHMIDIYNFFSQLLGIDGSLKDGKLNSYVLPLPLSKAITEFLQSIESAEMYLGNFKPTKPYIATSTKGNYLLSKPSGFTLFFRRWPLATLPKKVQRNVVTDPLLKTMTEWNNVIEKSLGL